MRTAIAERTVNNLKIMVAQTVAEVLNDPDFGLELSAKAKKQLGRASNVKQKTVSLSAVKRKYL